MANNQTQFQKGRSGNPKGRPRGSRNKLSEKFIADVEKDWNKYGRKVLENVRIMQPGIYLRVVSGLIIKDSPEDNLPEISFDEAREEIAEILYRYYPIRMNKDDEGDNAEPCVNNNQN